jgi:hypothetical protein
LLVLAMDAIPIIKFRCRLFIKRHPATLTLFHFFPFTAFHIHINRPINIFAGYFLSPFT